MDWNSAFLIAFVVLMLVCCGGMMRMAPREKPKNDDEKGEGERRDKDHEEHPQ